MNLSFFHHPVKSQDDESIKLAVVVHEHPHNTSEGSEFLDDAIRLKDQPLVYTEEKIAPGCPEDLL